MNVIKRDGSSEPLNIEKIHKVTQYATEGLDVSQSEIETEAHIMFFNGIKSADIHKSLISAAFTLISVENPEYTYAAARLLLQTIYKEVTGGSIDYPPLGEYLVKGIDSGQLNPKLLVHFDIDRLNSHIDKKRDMLFTYLGLQTLTDRYFVREAQKSSQKNPKLLEMPQHFWMRVAMGIALNEKREEATDYAIQFYDVLSQLLFVSSTPTLFNSGLIRSQMSSCYVNLVTDSIPGIFGTIKECAELSKYAGGIGTDWTGVRSSGEVIKGTNGKSSGVVPYLKVYNDTAVAVNQGGKRNGAFAAYLEPWHNDVHAFIDLKKNSGDERRRTHDIFPALWIPDLFMQRVKEDGDWSLFSPVDFPELHELYGKAFNDRYEQCERSGRVKNTVKARDLWRKIINSLYETGHPWITFKDEINRRSPQDHCGVVHSSNLCTEITLNTSEDETAVCNLGSINLARMNSFTLMRKVVPICVRMLDNVIDQNFYPSEKARLSNMRHRPIGLGVMGYTEWLIQRDIDWESEKHLYAADNLFATLSYMVIEASSDLAVEKGAYESFKGSKWSRGILPVDTAREVSEFGKSSVWDTLREKVKRDGMRNSNVMAIAPTATIANIAGTTPCIEPVYKRSYTKSNLSGYFDVIDPTLKYGKPELCKVAFEVDPVWVIRAAAVRQRYLDQSQSVNIFVPVGIKGQELADLYMLAWQEGLKTTYYLRSQAHELSKEPTGVCSITDPDCESCQ